MRAITLNFKNGELKVADVPTPRPGPRGILVANHHSLLSPGTESSIIGMARKGPIGKAMDRPDLARQVINRTLTEGVLGTVSVVRNLISAPLPLGYSSSGIVLETGRDVDLFRPGDLVACAGLGQANHAEHVAVPETMACKLPPNVSTEEGCFGTLGAIALHAVRLAKPEIGETFVVLGLGLIGQLCAQILRANGCRVIGFDIDADKVRYALASGVEGAGVIGQDDPKEVTLSHSGGSGADGVLIAAHTTSNRPLRMAADISRVRGRVVAVGVVNLKVPRRAFFEKEIRLEVSRAYGAGAYDAEYERKGRDYPLPYVRWTEGRNLAAFIDLVSRGRVDVKPLVTHRFTLDRAADAYAVALGEMREPHFGIVFQYGDGGGVATPTIQLSPRRADAAAADPLTFGVIGAGRFAQGILLPALTAHRGVRVAAVATAHGLTARHVADKYGADACSSDYREVIERPDVGSILIATRHASHAEIVSAALRAGKNVFVEKPLAIDEAQLADISAAHEGYAGTFMVGFNRRFSPLCQRFAKLLERRRQPLAVSFRFITQRILQGHESEWLQDRDIGGGRIVGEVCHLVDTCQFLVASRVRSVYARSIAGDAPDLPNYDTLHVTLGYEDGSIANLTYLGNSDASMPQERIELAWEGAFGAIDNFKRATFSRGGSRTRAFGVSQQKGWKEEMAVLVDCLRRRQPGPVPFASLVETTRVTFSIHRSLQTGQPVDL
jgi:predicted dehydrogenase/threonine dehydrogenase-like Zn-dependent dehydrogenase